MSDLGSQNLQVFPVGKDMEVLIINPQGWIATVVRGKYLEEMKTIFV